MSRNVWRGYLRGRSPKSNAFQSTFWIYIQGHSYWAWNLKGITVKSYKSKTHFVLACPVPLTVISAHWHPGADNAKHFWFLHSHSRAAVHIADSVHLLYNYSQPSSLPQLLFKASTLLTPVILRMLVVFWGNLILGPSLTFLKKLAIKVPDSMFGLFVAWVHSERKKYITVSTSVENFGLRVMS